MVASSLQVFDCVEAGASLVSYDVSRFVSPRGKPGGCPPRPPVKAGALPLSGDGGMWDAVCDGGIWVCCGVFRIAAVLEEACWAWSA